MQLAERMESAMNTNEDDSGDSESTGKSETLVLDNGANPSYIKTGMTVPTKLKSPTQVTTPNGKFQTNKAARITLKAPKQVIKARALVHNALPANLLSVTSIVERLGALLLDEKGAALLSKKTYKRIQKDLTYFGRRSNKVYHVPAKNGTIDLGAHNVTTDVHTLANKPPQGNKPQKDMQAQDITPRVKIEEETARQKGGQGGRNARSSCLAAQEHDDNVSMYNNVEKRPQQQNIPAARGRTNQQEQPTERKHRRQATNTQTRTLIPLRNNSKTKKFEADREKCPEAKQMPKDKWHLILNHASPKALTQLARNPKLRIPDLDSIRTTNDITCRACYEGKLARAPHRRIEHTYEQGKSFSSNIIGPLHVPGIPTDVNRYNLSRLWTRQRDMRMQQLSRQEDKQAK